MTVESSVVLSGPFTGNGVTTNFPRDFSVGDADHVYVTVDGVAVTSGYTVLTPESVDADVQFDVAPASGVEIFLTRVTPVTQDTDYSSQGTVSPEQVERDLDQIYRVLQEQAKDLNRSVKIATGGDAPTDITKVDNAAIGWDDNGLFGAIPVVSTALATEVLNAASVIQPFVDGEHRRFNPTEITELYQWASDAADADNPVIIELAPGDYNDVPGNLRIPSNSSLIVPRGIATLKLVAGANASGIVPGNYLNSNGNININILGKVKLDGNHDNQGSIASTIGTNGGMSGIWMPNVENCLIDGAIVFDWRLHGIDFSITGSLEDNPNGDTGCLNCHVKNVDVSQFGDDGVTSHFATKIFVEDSYIYDSRYMLHGPPGTGLGSQDVNWYSANSAGCEADDGTDGFYTKDVWVQNCRIGFTGQGHGVNATDAAKNIKHLRPVAIGCDVCAHKTQVTSATSVAGAYGYDVIDGRSIDCPQVFINEDWRTARIQSTSEGTGNSNGSTTVQFIFDHTEPENFDIEIVQHNPAKTNSISWATYSDDQKKQVRALLSYREVAGANIGERVTDFYGADGHQTLQDFGSGIVVRNNGDAGTSLIVSQSTGGTGALAQWYAAGTLLRLEQAANGQLTTVNNAGANIARQHKIDGEAAARFRYNGFGAMEWGNGTTAPDTLLERISASLLGMGAGDSFKVEGVYNGGTLQIEDFHIWEDGTGKLRFKDGAPTTATDGTILDPNDISELPVVASAAAAPVGSRARTTSNYLVGG